MQTSNIKNQGDIRNQKKAEVLQRILSQLLVETYFARLSYPGSFRALLRRCRFRSEAYNAGSSPCGERSPRESWLCKPNPQ